MLIGLRLLLLVAGLGCAITLLGYAFTRNPRFLTFTRKIIQVSVLIALLLMALVVGERLVLR